MRRAINDALKRTYTREVCNDHAAQLKERVELQPTAPPYLAGLLEKGIALNLRAIEHCRELYPDEYEPYQMFGKEVGHPDS